MNGLKTTSIMVSLIFSLSMMISPVHAEVGVSDWTVHTGKGILDDPNVKKILENIEISKQRLYELQNPTKVMTEHEIFIEEQRKIAQDQLDEILDRMNKRYADFTPRAAFAKHVAQYPVMYHEYLWELFDHLYSKVTIAREYRDGIIANGGSYSDAQKLFIEYATITLAERTQVEYDLALKHGLINKVSNIDDFEDLPDRTKNAFISFMTAKGLGAFALNPIYDIEDDSIVEAGSDETITEPVFEKSSQTLIQFSGNDYEISDSSPVNSFSEFSISAWVKPDYSKGSAEFTVASKENAFILTINNNNLLEKTAKFSVFNGFKWTSIEAYTTIDEEWTHLVATIDGSAIKLYVNGNLETTGYIEDIFTMNSRGYFELMPVQEISSSSALIIGAQESTRDGLISTLGFFSGQVDEIFIDDKLLDADQIEEKCTSSNYFSA